MPGLSNPNSLSLVYLIKKKIKKKVGNKYER